MEILKTKIIGLLESRNQFLVPIYQRLYSWEKSNCQRLWDDILKIGQDENSNHIHFIGSIIYFVENDEHPITKNSLIDGQQRLTTISLLIKALTEFIKINKIDTKFASILLDETGLFNRHCSDKLKFKLQLANRDNTTLEKIIQGNPPIEDKERSTNLNKNYQFFKNKINAKNAETICLGLNRLWVIDVKLKRGDDNPQLIFETINSTGKRLDEADKIRNWLFMGLCPVTQRTYYVEHWDPMEKLYGRKFPNHFESFVRYYLSLKIGSDVKKDQVYNKYVEWAENEKQTKEKLIENLANYSRLFVTMTLDNEKERSLKKVFKNISDISFTTCYSLLLGIYNDFIDNTIDLTTFLKVLNIIESHYIRKQICDLQTQGFNKFYPTIYGKIDRENYLNSLIAILVKNTKSTRRFPNNKEFRENFVAKEIKSNLRKYLLVEIENFETKEPIDTSNLSVEHILPQNDNLNQQWRDMLGPNWNNIQKKYLHTIGNLTLTGYNSELRDSHFIKKKAIEVGYDKSPLRINHSLKITDKWNEETIKDRANKLYEVAEKRWPLPETSINQ